MIKNNKTTIKGNMEGNHLFVTSTFLESKNSRSKTEILDLTRGWSRQLQELEERKTILL
jgi:hypothetical protein